MAKDKMKAVVYRQYGSPQVLQLMEVNKPVPLENEILIRVKATAVNSGDCRIRKADPFAVRFFFGLMKPKKNILGGVFSGVIEAIGKNVKLFKVGNEVFGSTGMGFGAYAEYKCLPENAVLAIKPEHITHTEAAAIPFGGNTALYFLKKANIKAGQKVLIYGASGSVGSAAIQLAKHFGADVTGICSTTNIEMVKSLGADKVIDYTQEDFTKNGETYDVIYDTVNGMSFSDGLSSLNENGIMLLSAGGLSEMFNGIWTSITTSKKVITGVVKETLEDMNFLKKLVMDGKLKPVIDITYSLKEIQEAHAYVDKGHKKGNVAITLFE